ncbi:HD family phosphohydrolase [Planctomicrobium piriforme]|uniref:HD family phosphohydrolase n=1 Tax=Planctomicrobium piriforme TaxID=1576369 RepID=UPI0015870E3A|nr:HDIG domain-containing metalloprotein [Planctomicrobium piriforme]
MWTRLSNVFHNRSLQLRLGIIFFELLLLVLALQSWRAPFGFRLGDYVPHGISAKIPFERIDQEETERARDRAEEGVALIFRNNPTSLQSLPAELRAELGDIAQADSLTKLGSETLEDFGLTNTVPQTEKAKEAAERYGAKSPEDRFEKLRAAVVGPDQSMAQSRIDEMVEEFAQFIGPLFDTGIIDPKDVRRGITPDKRILVVDENQPDHTGRDALLPQVRLQDQLNEAGNLGRSWGKYPSLKKDIQPALSYWLFKRVQPTLRYDQAGTKSAIAKARENVEVRLERFIEGDSLIRPKETIDAERLTLLQDEYAAAENEIGWGARLTRVGIVFIMVLVLAGLNGFYIVLNEPKLARDVGRLITYCTALVITAFVGRLVSFDPLRAEIVPLLTVVLLIGVAYNQFLATLTAFSLALVLTMSTTGRLEDFLVLLSTCAAAIIPLRRVSSRATLIKVSFISALTYFVISCGSAVVETQSLSEVYNNTQFLVMSAKGASLCLVAGYLVAGSLPFVEKVFGVVTDMTLLELSDPSHPLLQDLVRLAPGTYNHSIAVASIAETAVEKIGGNGLLVRVGAYFHDIGKMLKPQYFIENVQEGSVSRHAQLNPAMSTLIIIGHVKDGADLAEQYGLPQPIIDLIEQHHGTTLVEYFFREATRIAECTPDHRNDAEESSFRYPGPKPQTKEAGVLMIVDACESACRTLTEPTPKRIESLVSNIVMRRLLDDQFDECDLKMSDIRVIQDSVIKSLIAVYHGRIKYPELQEARTA